MKNKVNWKNMSLLMVCGFGLNILLSRLVLLFKLPLFLDCVGTILCSVIGGYIPGIVVGFLTNLVNSISDPITLYYGLLNLFIAMVACLFVSTGFYRNYFRILISFVFYAFIGGFLGSLMTYLLYGKGIGTGISAPLALIIQNRTNYGTFWSQMISDVAIDLADKLLVMILVIIALKLIPKKFISSFEWGETFRQSMDGNRKKKQGLFHLLRHSLSHKITGIICLTALIIAALAVVLSCTLYSRAILNNYTETGNTALAAIKDIIDGDKIEDWLENGEDEEYWKVSEEMQLMQSFIPAIRFAYVYQYSEDGCTVIFDLDTPEVPGDRLGDHVDLDRFLEDHLPQLLRGEGIEPININSRDGYGWMLSLYSPIFDSSGRCAAYAMVDISTADFIRERYIFVISIIALMFMAMIPIVSFCLNYLHNNLVRPLNKLSSAYRKFAFESKEDRQKNTLQLKSLNISSGDEVESLYWSLWKTTDDVSHLITQIDEKNIELSRRAADITNLQTNIIECFAKLVEERDKNTGGHITRTASYVRAIARALSKNPNYREFITEDFIYTIKRSAPLHDIGKIRIPEAILNKPGKLTAEEFEIIKLHPGAGKEILERVFSSIESPSDLSFAIEMAYCHHEHWDGTGYPSGLKGRSIPLSARIMAVADVLDALSSKRSYKEAYSIDVSLKMIREESGTHFDPGIVAVLSQIQGELEKITILKTE